MVSDFETDNLSEILVRDWSENSPFGIYLIWKINVYCGIVLSGIHE